VAKLFAAIFLTIIPAIAILRAGNAGVLAPLVTLVSDPTGAPNNVLYFWITGMLSSVLDNAPTYLVFFNVAGGNPTELMGPFGKDAHGNFCGCRVHGRDDLYRKCTQFHGQVDCRGARCEDAELYRIHGMVDCNSTARIRSPDDSVFCLAIC
jgi:hypothetical protein